ncbi:MAG: hypothetical protein ABJG41_16915 [Cyclobacteriaceae bacterium]
MKNSLNHFVLLALMLFSISCSDSGSELEQMPSLKSELIEYFHSQSLEILYSEDGFQVLEISENNLEYILNIIELRSIQLPDIFASLDSNSNGRIEKTVFKFLWHSDCFFSIMACYDYNANDWHCEYVAHNVDGCG